MCHWSLAWTLCHHPYNPQCTFVLQTQAGEEASREEPRVETRDLAILDPHPLTTSAWRHNPRDIFTAPTFTRSKASARDSPAPGSIATTPMSQTAQPRSVETSHPCMEAANTKSQPRRPKKRKQEQYHMWLPEELEVLKTAFQLAAKRKRLPSYK
jgi:hypothetical protein